MGLICVLYLGKMEWWHAGREEEEEEEEDCRWVPSLIRGEKCLAEGLMIYTLPMTCLNKECQSGEREREKSRGQETKGWMRMSMSGCCCVLFSHSKLKYQNKKRQLLNCMLRSCWNLFFNSNLYNKIIMRHIRHHTCPRHFIQPNICCARLSVFPTIVQFQYILQQISQLQTLMCDVTPCTD